MSGTSHPKTQRLIQKDLNPQLQHWKNLKSHKHKEFFLSYFVLGSPWNLWHKSTNNSHFFIGFEAETLCHAVFRYVKDAESYFSVHMKSHMKKLLSFCPRLTEMLHRYSFFLLLLLFSISFTEQNQNQDSMKSGGTRMEKTWKYCNYKLQKTSQCTWFLV